MECFTTALYFPNERVEARAIETWSRNEKRLSRLEARFWFQAQEIRFHYQELQRLNTTANIFFGVNPRVRASGTKSDIAVCRNLWVDLDHITHDEARKRWEAHVPPPTTVVDSGHGIHAYWRLCQDIPVSQQLDRDRFEAMLKAFSKDLGGDATHDVSRLLRVPGFRNVKDLRNGRAPVPCRLLVYEPERAYPLEVFSRWEVPKVELEDARSFTPLSSATFKSERERRRIEGLVRRLDRDVPDRSRRDFGVICALLEMLTPEEIWDIVRDHSKFATAGEKYFETTLKNALRRLGHREH
jgi:hypothetical protein